MIEQRIWVFGSDDHYIPSFLEGMSLAHKQPIKSMDWFHWKFEHSPYGKAILACAFDNDMVAGCVAYGKGRVQYCGEEWASALSYETFVHPKYQGQGLFKKLIDLAEEEARSQHISFLYNFPNSNSLTGFKHKGWIERNDKLTFRLKVVRPLRLLFHYNDMKAPFSPGKSNLNQLKTPSFVGVDMVKCSEHVVTPLWTSEYLKWRFFSFPNRQYHVIDTDDFFSISMVGHRGVLINVHLLYVYLKREDIDIISCVRRIERCIERDLHPDMISYASTVDDTIISALRGYISVPSHTNFCYKILNPGFNIDVFKIMLPSINAHTY